MRSTGRMAALLALAALALLAAGCASHKAFRDAQQAEKRERWDQAVLNYAKAVQEHPGNLQYKVSLERAKLRAANEHFERGKRYLAAGQTELAIAELEQTVMLHPSNQYAVNELSKAMLDLERSRRGPSEIETAKREAAARALALGPPKLDPTSNIPIVLRFPESTVGKVYEAVSKASGINFLYDERVNLDEDMSIDIANVSFAKAMDILMLQNKHFYKVIDAHTLLIAEDNRQSRQEYEDQVIRTFYLSNAETKQVQTLLRTLLDTRKVTENPALNSITIKDTPEKIKVSELIISSNDKSKAELVIDVELLEIDRNMTQELGFDLTSKNLFLTFNPEGSSEEDGASLRLNNLNAVRQDANWLLGPIPGVVFNFMKSDSDTKFLARPQLRVSEGEKAEFIIGNRVPIPATTFNTSQTIGGNIVPVTSFTYQNVGITVEIEPRVHHNKEITLKVKVELSQISGSVEGTGGVSQPIIGTRNIATVIRLQDGETNLLAGIVSEEDRTSLSGVPGLSDIPGLRHIFGSTEEEARSTDIVLAITPHIIRVPNIVTTDLMPIWVGTEDKVQLRGPIFNAWGENPFATNGEAGAVATGVVAEESLPRPGEGTRLDQVSAGEGGGARPGAGRRRAAAAGGAAGAAAGAATPRGEAQPEAGAGGVEATGADVGEEGEGEEPRRPATVTRIQIVPSTTSPGVGDSLEVAVQVSEASNVGTVSFRLRYDPAVLEFVPPALPGDFLEQAGGSGNVSAVESASGGEIVVTASRFGDGVTGQGTLASFQFVTLSPGPAGLSLTAASVRDPDDANLPSSFRTAQVTVQE